MAAFSQGVINFDINFGENPPPHEFGIPTSGAQLSNDVFAAALYLSDVAPTSGSIVELDGSSYTTILQFGTPVYATYPPPATSAAYSYEGSWDLTASQTDNLLAGDWYAEVNYDGTSYLGQITAVPEPSETAFLVSGLIILGSRLRRRNR